MRCIATVTTLLAIALGRSGALVTPQEWSDLGAFDVGALAAMPGGGGPAAAARETPRGLPLRGPRERTFDSAHL